MVGGVLVQKSIPVVGWFIILKKKKSGGSGVMQEINSGGGWYNYIPRTKVGGYIGFDVVTPPRPRPPRAPQTLSCSEHKSNTVWNILTKLRTCIDIESKVSRTQA